MDDPREFWARFGGARVVLWTYKDKDSEEIELEDLYAQFKARMVAELYAAGNGRLIERGCGIWD